MRVVGDLMVIDAGSSIGMYHVEDAGIYPYRLYCAILLVINFKLQYRNSELYQAHFRDLARVSRKVKFNLAHSLRCLNFARRAMPV